MDDLVEEGPGPEGRILFQHPNRRVSVVFLVFGLIFIAAAFVFYMGSGPVDWAQGSLSNDPYSHRYMFLLGSAGCGLLGLLFGICALILVWTRRHLEIDVAERTLVDVRRTPLGQRSKEYEPAMIEFIVLRENPPSDNDARPVVPDHSVEIVFTKGADFHLGTGSDWKAKRLAQRISDLTGARLREEKRPK